MYVDPSRVQMALRFASLAQQASETRAAKNVDATLFIASVWADATPSARTQYKASVASVSGALPWAALTKPPNITASMQHGKFGLLTPDVQGPPVLLLILGQKDPEDEGVDSYRLIAGDPRADIIVEALRRWDVPLLTRTASPAGWNLDAADQPVDVGADKGPKDAPGESPEPAPEPEAQPSSAPEVDSGEGPTRGQKQLAAAGIAAGFALLGFTAWRLG